MYQTSLQPIRNQGFYQLRSAQNATDGPQYASLDSGFPVKNKFDEPAITTVDYLTPPDGYKEGNIFGKLFDYADSAMDDLFSDIKNIKSAALRAVGVENSPKQEGLQAELEWWELDRIKDLRDRGEFAEGYRYILDQAGDRIDSNTRYWLQQAASINANEDTPSNTFIREATIAGLRFDGDTRSDAEIKIHLQNTSDQIATNVLSDVYNSEGVPSFKRFVTNDIKAALKEGGQTLAGWGGSFYFWDFEFEGGKTVGQIINSDHNEQDKFTNSFYKASTATIQRHGIDAFDDVLEIIRTKPREPLNNLPILVSF